MEQGLLKSFKDLAVWKKAVNLATLIYSLTEKFPKSELYGITNQMRRAVVSISSNLAEGFKRSHKKEKLQFYNIAYSSAAELESQIEIAYRLGFLNKEDYEKLNFYIIEVSKMMSGFIKATNKSFPKFYILYSISLVLALYSIFHILNPLPVQAAQLYFSPQEAVIGTTGEFRVAVNISAEDAINAVAAAISFSPEISPYDVSDGSSIINLWLDKPHWDEASRLLTFSGIIPGGFIGKDAPLLILKLQVAGDGKTEALLSFNQEQTKIYLHTPDGIEDELELAELRLPIARGKENIPVKLRDTAPPEPFIPIITRDASIFNNKWFLVFSTQDKASGLFGYDVAEKQGKLVENYNKLSWQVAASPFLLYDQELKSYIYVKAIDKAGNEQIVFLLPQEPLAWYENDLIYVIIIIVVSIITACLLWTNSRRKRILPG